MKGIIAAAGKGSRLFPLTEGVSKHLLPVYNKPLIYYPITNLIAAGINEICIITNPDELKLYKKLLGTGSQLGCRFEFFEQKEALGIPDVLNYSSQVYGEEPVTLILGDNVFAASDSLINSMREKEVLGAKIFATTVEDPERFGVVNLDFTMKIKSLEEKPVKPKSNYAIIGVYIFDKIVFEYLKNINPSKRGELEIIDILKMYLSDNKLSLDVLKRGSVWFDAGTPEALLRASLFVELFEKQSGVMIGCIEEAALVRGFLTKYEFSNIVKLMPSSNYKKYLKNLI
mgnify:CR=1 FL=1